MRSLNFFAPIALFIAHYFVLDWITSSDEYTQEYKVFIDNISHLKLADFILKGFL